MNNAHINKIRKTSLLRWLTRSSAAIRRDSFDSRAVEPKTSPLGTRVESASPAAAEIIPLIQPFSHLFKNKLQLRREYRAGGDITPSVVDKEEAADSLFQTAERRIWQLDESTPLSITIPILSSRDLIKCQAIFSQVMYISLFIVFAARFLTSSYIRVYFSPAALCVHHKVLDARGRKL